MLQFYIPEVLGVEQVYEEHEKVIESYFEKVDSEIKSKESHPVVSQ